MEKLDSFSKILLATASINYMSSCVNGVVQQMKMIPKAANIDDVKRSMIDKRRHFGRIVGEIKRSHGGYW